MKGLRWLKLIGAAFGVWAMICVVPFYLTGREIARLNRIAGTAFTPPASMNAAIDQAKAYAQTMLGHPYDPLMGRLGDPFGKIGFVVCIDVPVRSYQSAGVAMPALLKESAQQHPEWFSIGPANSPTNSFFYRRVKNYFALFKHHPQLVADTKPQVGDWAFYDTSHIALVVDAAPDGSFKVVEASPVKGRVAISDGKYMSRTWGPPSFFGRIRTSP